MNISFSRMSQVVVSLRKQSPLSVLFLGCIVFLGLNETWRRELFGSGMEVTSSIMLGVLMLVLLILTVSSVQKSRLTSWTSQIVSLLLVVGGAVRRWILQPEPISAEGIGLAVIAGVVGLGLVGIPYIISACKDRDIHHWILGLIMQFFIARAFSVLLGGGISLAFLAIDSLFGLTIDGEWYATIWLVSFIFLGGMSFLEGLFSKPLTPSIQEPIHKWKKMLARVLGFLLLVFGVILYTYMIKILITRNRPSNEVTFWAFLYSGLVIVASLILLPVRQDDNDHLYRMRQWMYASILPMGVMISVAIWQRVEQYGITVPRYLVIVFLIWLSAMSVLMIVRKRLHIWRLFVSLMGVGVVSVFAPWIGAGCVAYQSQLAIVTTILEDTGNITEQGVRLPLAGLSDDQAHQVAQSVGYIIDDLGQNLNSLDERLGEADEIYDQLGIDQPVYYRGGRLEEENERRHYRVDTNDMINVSGYMVFQQNIYLNNDGADYKNQGGTQTVRLEGNTILVDIISESSSESKTRMIDLDGYVDAVLMLEETNTYLKEELIYAEDNIKLLVTSLSIDQSGDEPVIESIGFGMLQ